MKESFSTRKRSKNGRSVTNLRLRTPSQERSQNRVALVLETTELLLVELGPEEISIPEISKRSGIPRASIYQFFPDKYSLFTRLAEKHLSRVGEILEEKSAKSARLSWKKLVRLLVNAASDYYDSNPVASILVLGGPFSRNAYLAQEITIDHIGAAVRIQLSGLKEPLIVPEKPDVATLGVEIAFACMKRGYYSENRISKTIRDHAADAVISYFESQI
ncbi:TetR/AcrR family transcriptional regulator [Leptospira gomenensis]|uniref:TetR/AcrR family transcriptional regulator n=1 Tax=Leptospira gomenensis TaxID=2484974 RepID=A0A5F1YYU3_9LEPT|nr:TetR/AcrR family transcriptional regulator [Leptospira gomenensis]TGK29426.1 TetR/AcrR family transcriptional regulator [Leptospira gomenensis]TGK33671.1 TetR/AcrR family transcriptional regulator [Leptospira gomenensis]TGK44912.1 TetR/AcrR family transcriptional regulator [Leptospira gomenensis]TGK64533.1 TetR/AcrR family transcriptional regulator [Leptospira gomenensis]